MKIETESVFTFENMKSKQKYAVKHKLQISNANE